MTYQVVPLSEIAKVERDGIDPTAIKSGIRYVGLEHIDSSGAVQGQIVQNGDLASTKFVFSKDHILFGKLRPYLRKIARPEFDGICSTDIVPIRPGSKVDRGYLFHFLRVNEVVNRAALLATGVNLPRLSPHLLEMFEIPLPPLDQQRRIAAILDQADDLRRKRREAIDRLAILGQAIFSAMFPPSELPRVPLTNLLNIETGLVDPTEEQYINLPHIAPDSIESDSGELLDYRSAGEDGVFSKKYFFGEGSVLYSKIRPYLNKVALAPEKGVCSADMYVLQPIKGASTREYLWYLLRSGDFLKFAERHSGRLSIPKLNRDQMASYQAPAPRFERQLEFSKSATEIIVVKARHRAHLAKLDALFAALQHRAFRGEL